MASNVVKGIKGFVQQDQEARFWGKVTKSAGEGCWEWRAAMTSNGYGSFHNPGGSAVAHRYAWERQNGPVPEGMELDHLCRNRSCVRPDHLEPVSHQENMRRAPRHVFGGNRYKTHCPKGHPYDDANTYVPPKGGRVCRQCKIDKRPLKNAGVRARKAAQRALADTRPSGEAA